MSKNDEQHFYGFVRGDDGLYHMVVANNHQGTNDSSQDWDIHIDCLLKLDGFRGQYVGELPEDGKLCPKCQEHHPVFMVNDHFNGFSLVHTRTGETAWLSDGVDVLFDEEGKALSPGTPGFRKKWEDSMNGDSEIYEAYFPDLDPDDYD